MADFYYYDTDASGEAEYDISGEEYRLLLETCFKYGEYFSFRYFEDRVNVPAGILRYAVSAKEANINCVFSTRKLENESGTAVCDQTVFLRLTDEVKKWILSVTDSIFKWIDGWGNKNPEDPMFYRADGSVLFESVIHDGVIHFNASENENLSAILSDPLWTIKKPQ
ncbi:MAG: hypothetical protein IJR90_02790 [Clostridia bacterium]|nr:hypothetical protein [Clostridia bacterium]